VGWLESVTWTRAGSAGVDPVKWDCRARWADKDGQAIEIVVPSVWPYEMPSLVQGLHDDAWGPLNLWTWIATHS
jgi:hypothetical protein